jgi:Protein of unknown function (DUF1657)
MLMKKEIISVVSYFLMKEGIEMTVATNIKQTIAGLKSAQASFETFALATDNKAAKQLYQDAAQQTQSIIDNVQPRLQQIQQEEPQYK